MFLQKRKMFWNDTIKLQDKGATQIVAHRGFSWLERENTINAFVVATQRSVYGVECDIHITKDGKYMVYHDNDTSRLCNKNISVEGSTFDELRALKMRKPYSEEFSDYLKIPTLEEYLELMKRYTKVAIIEIKNEMNKENIEEVVDICERVYDLDKIVFISFSFDNLLRIRAYKPTQKLQYLCGEVDDKLMEKLVRYTIGIDIAYTSLNKKNVAKMKGKGIVINCFTCNDLKDGEKLVELGVDFITTDILE